MDKSSPLDTAPRFVLSDNFQRIHLSLASSTNQLLLDGANQAYNDRLWLSADEQNGGRGRSGRKWHSPKGNLYASVLLISPAPSEVMATLSLVCSLAVHDVIAELSTKAKDNNKKVELKWPNDVLINERKVCGLLLEAKVINEEKVAIVAGFGINCLNGPPKSEDMLFPPTCLHDEGLSADVEGVFNSLNLAFSKRLIEWDEGRGLASIIHDWRAKAHGIGQPIRVRTSNDIMHGTFENIDEDGCLLLRTSQKQLKISAADVFLG